MMKCKRRDGWYEVTGNGHYFQITKWGADHMGRHWQVIEFYGKVDGKDLGQSPDNWFATKREAMDHCRMVIECSRKDES